VLPWGNMHFQNFKLFCWQQPRIFVNKQAWTVHREAVVLTENIIFMPFPARNATKMLW
jgi:hypothetical protein